GRNSSPNFVKGESSNSNVKNNYQGFSKNVKSFQKPKYSHVNFNFQNRNTLTEKIIDLLKELLKSNSQGYSQYNKQKKSNYSPKPKTVLKWVPKVGCLVAHTAFKATSHSKWYLDSGCSRHMTGDKNLFTDLKDMTDGSVTFGDGSNCKIIGQGTVQLCNFPLFKNVLYVEGLKHNLLSIS
ncbi:hypothetical protein, partial [Cobetia crustatorum]|uniref:hypothetical protein n=1 Tax=Cobetia crustatorum TaxID=553385 RepID=UPI001C94DBA7